MPLSYFETCDTFRPPRCGTGLSPGNITIEAARVIALLQQATLPVFHARP
jgi:hypothetical protein